MVWIKFIHISALAIWMAGLLYLPALIIAHRRIEDQQDFARVRMSSRFVFLLIASPAACVAVGAGTVLLFLTDALHPWMLMKLGAVGLLAICHFRFGSLLVHLAEYAPNFPTFQARFFALLAACAGALALWLVLAKPFVGNDVIPDWLKEPRSASPVSVSASHLPGH